MPKKRVLFLLTQIFDHGGIPRFNRNLVKSLPDSFDAEVLSLNDESKNNVVGFKRNKLLFVVHTFICLIQKPDLVIIGHINFAPLIVLIRLFGLKNSLVLHGVEAWNPKSSQKLFLTYIRKFWPVSTYTRDRFLATTGVPSSRIELIFNALPSNWKMRKHDGTEVKMILTVTRLDKNDGYKGVKEAISAIAILKKEAKFESWRYKIVGSGSDLETHQQMVRDLNLTDDVEFMLNVSDEELKTLYDQCAFFLLVSTGEGFGIVYLEAMASAKPCVGSINSGAQDVIVDQQTGYLVNQTPEDIAQAISNLINDPSLRRNMGKLGFNRLNERFTYDKFQMRIKELIKNTCVE